MSESLEYPAEICRLIRSSHDYFFLFCVCPGCLVSPLPRKAWGCSDRAHSDAGVFPVPECEEDYTIRL